MSKIRLSVKDKKPINLKLENPVIEIEPKLENLEITPSKEEQTFKSKDYYGYDNVTINPVTNSIDENIKPENIKKDVSILGVTGNVEEINTTEISINPTETEQVITPEEPYNGFSKVTVGAQSGINPAEYFETTVTSSNRNNFGINTLIKKIPNIIIDQSVTNLQYLFQNAFYLKSLNLVIDDNREFDCYSTFYNCTNLREVKGLEKTKIINAENMFYNCSKLVDIPDIDTSLVQSFSSAFQNCSGLTNVNNLDTSNATGMGNMFSGCPKLEQVRNLLTSNVKFFNYMFSYCSNLKIIDELDASSCTFINYMFNGTKSYFTDFGGLKDLGKAYLTTQSANNSAYTLNLSSCINLTHESLMNVINNLYDIASIGVQPQKLQLGSTNLAKLTDEEKAIAQNKGWSLS